MFNEKPCSISPYCVHGSQNAQCLSAHSHCAVVYWAYNNTVRVCSLFFFCPSLPVDAFRPTQPFLVKVKVDRGVQYKVAYRWPLAELKLVDGKSLDQVRMIL